MSAKKVYWPVIVDCGQGPINILETSFVLYLKSVEWILCRIATRPTKTVKIKSFENFVLYGITTTPLPNYASIETADSIISLFYAHAPTAGFLI